MDQVMNKLGTYWFSKRADKEISSVGDDLNSLSTSIEGGAKWLVNKLKGKMQKPLPELLQEHDLPFNEETRKLTVFVPSVCEVGYKDSSVLRFLTITKVLVWQKVTCISTEGSKVHFTTTLKKTRSRAAYEVLRDGISIEKF
ncbi:unnamed protein product [Spirodela intermedia]|uniref:Uncharacterized protein n=1 Tax=Spirodela intermedia TaxID=51605 RepID=A0A7I8JGK5_SPIIN|nr:unnamed protein product [Spirodela intermedia]CAA6669289.1 unnamed protein product [Spirodela intermedia]